MAGHSEAARQRTVALARVIAMVNDKGGVGKTSLVANLAVHAEVRAEVENAFGGHSPLLAASVRHAERSAQDARRLGKLAHELELEVAAQPAWWTSLRDGTGTGGRLSTTAASVAGDYRDVAVELLTLLRTVEEPVADQTRAEATR